MKTVMAIALGGALGAVARHFISHWSVVALGNGFPWGTLTVNVVGCFALGVVVEVMALVWSPAAEWRAFLTVGVLGAFTTFSAFALDISILHERGEMLQAILYVTVSVAGSIAAIFAGMSLTRAGLQ
tara:strand:+ start:202 stop:582 length:381 start_codon:yes stop_codon:yes gene_type:complete